MGELAGVFAGMLSNVLGGTAIGVTRHAIGATDPLTLGALRFGIGFLFLLPIALATGGRWPARADWPAVAVLDLLFFAVFPVLFNASLIFTTAARAALAVATLPLLSMLVGAALRVEALTPRKTAGVLVATAGVAAALLSGAGLAPPGAWRGDLLMVAGALCLALYNVLARPYIARSGPVRFTTAGMGLGAAVLVVAAWLGGGLGAVRGFGAPEWAAAAYLGVFGSAATFVLLAFALTRTTPTRVTISIPLNPLAASLVGALLLGEPLGWSLLLGLATVFLGIWLAAPRRPAA